MARNKQYLCNHKGCKCFFFSSLDLKQHKVIHYVKPSRKEALGSSCLVCGNQGEIKHHLSYIPEYIIMVCRKCHGKIHSGKLKDWSTQSNYGAINIRDGYLLKSRLNEYEKLIKYGAPLPPRA